MEETVESSLHDCENEEKWEYGGEILNRLRQYRKETSLTGKLSFDENGNRVDYALDIVELNSKNVRRLAVWNSERPYSLDITVSEDESRQEKLQSLSEMEFIVSSRIGAPYLDYNPNSTETDGNNRYMGFSKDLMDHIAKTLNFTYKIKLTPDGKYGNYDPEKKQWNGLIRDLLERDAHLAICDLTITHQRRSVVDFSSPFMSLGK